MKKCAMLHKQVLNWIEEPWSDPNKSMQMLAAKFEFMRDSSIQIQMESKPSCQHGISLATTSLRRGFRECLETFYFFIRVREGIAR